ncbi:urea transport system substrate-binding protein [Variovorax sp. TBS-050B]|nr:urea transport system substrate-binding protein [Variovorax sp. TBS-050B]
MSRDSDPSLDALALRRRRLLQGAAALPVMGLSGLSFGQGQFPTAKVNTTKLAVTDTEVTVGQLHSSTGTMAISETGSIQAEQLAIDQINAMGGILGRKIKVIKEDGASDWPTFAEKSKKLLVNDKVAAVFGCWTSASRKAVLPVFEKENGLLYYPTFYEGLEQSKNVIYTGQEATQQIIWGLDWGAKEKKAKTFFLVGSDYIWPRTSMKIARKHIENFQKGTVKGEEYYPLGHTNFNSLINKIKVAKPDCIFAAVVGGSNVAFYKQLKAAGITGDKQFLLTLAVTEDEMTGVGGENFAGFYSSMKYFQSLDNPNNKKFVEAFKAKYGKDAVDRRRHAGGLPRPLALEGRGREGRQLRRRQGGGRLAGHRAQDRARRLREARCEPPPVEQGAHRAGAAGRQLQGGGGVERADQAGSVPQGLPVTFSPSPAGGGQGWGQATLPSSPPHAPIPTFPQRGKEPENQQRTSP